MADRLIFRGWWLLLSWVPTTLGGLQRRRRPESSLAQRIRDWGVPTLAVRQDVTASTFLLRMEYARS